MNIIDYGWNQNQGLLVGPVLTVKWPTYFFPGGAAPSEEENSKEGWHIDAKEMYRSGSIIRIGVG